jgi:hypothetical protein
VAILEPNDPRYEVRLPSVDELYLTLASDVTEIIGTSKVDLGFKAMIHTLAVSV